MIEILTSLLVVITAVYAYLTFRILQANRASVAAMNAQVEAATRPYVTVAFSRERSGFLGFTVCNVGQSAARDLQLKSEPEIKPVRAAGSATTAGRISDSIGLFHHAIPYLAPAQSLEALIGHYSGVKASYPELRFTISVQYSGSAGRYVETVELSLKPTDDAQHLADYEIGKELHEIKETLEGIKSQLKT
jgi:hypothetical protein